MNLSRDNQIEYITKQFHQFFNIEFKSNKNLFSHEKSDDYYDNQSNEDILNKYSNTNILTERTGFCERVIDGDTIILRTGERIRLVGVNTPEKDMPGFTVSKKFVEKLCLNQDIGLNIDDKNPKDKYGRTLAVVIINNKNLNEILLKEGLAEIMYIPPSEFNPFSWNNETAPEVNESLLSTNLINQFINIVIPIDEIIGNDYGVTPLSKYFNEDYTNIVVSSPDDFKIIYSHEVYKKSIFIRVEPINILTDDLTLNLTIHILPKKYNCNDDLLIFKDDIGFLKRKGLELTHIPDNTNYYKVHDFFEEDEDGNLILDNYQEPIKTDIINSFYQAIINGQEKNDRYHVVNMEYPMFDKFTHSQFKYQVYNDGWVKEAWDDLYDIFTEFDCNISGFTRNMRNIEIDSCYEYNDSSPFNAVHYIGTKDVTNEEIPDRCTLIDANLDKVINEKTNFISQFELENNKVIFPKTLNAVQLENSYIHNHTYNIGAKHYKRTKYFNDRLYSEEKNINDGEVSNFGYTVGDWIDWSQ